MTGTCAACGGVARLGPDGVCAWQAGCEHRQAQAEAIERTIDAQVERLDGMVHGALRDELMASARRHEDRLLAAASPIHPYDRDLAAYHERAVAALGGPVCVHCVAQAN